MNGVHDMGGMHGFGPVIEEKNEPPFHERWEGRSFAMNRAMGVIGVWNLDMSRYAQETLPPAVYLGSAYYDRWARGLERLLLQTGLVTKEEMAVGRSLNPPRKLAYKLKPEDADKLTARNSYARPAPAPAQFIVGERVRAKTINPPTHTRLPRYARGRTGIVEAIRGCHVFPDSTTTGKGEDPHWLYTVVFDGRELWGPESDPTIKVSIEAWEPYLEHA
jgi:nitrile hydratase